MDNIIGIGVGVILLNKNNEILLLLRNSDPKLADSNMHYEGQYTLPAGKIKFGEEFEEAGIRKVKQETNLDVLDIETICLVNSKTPFEVLQTGHHLLTVVSNGAQISQTSALKLPAKRGMKPVIQ